MTGDMMNRDDDELENLLNLVKMSREIAPVYFSLGNHEYDYIELNGSDQELIAAVEEAGAIVLEKEYRDIEVNHLELRIGGLYGYALCHEWKDGSEQRFMEDFPGIRKGCLSMSRKSGY